MPAKEPTTQSATHHRRRRLALWIALGVVLCLAAAALGLIRTLPQAALSQVERLTHTSLACGSLRVHGNGTVTIEDFTVRPRDRALRDDDILRARRVRARFGVLSLILLRPQLKELTIEDFVLQAQLDLDTGRWNVGAVTVSIPKGRGGTMPDIHLIGGTLKYTRVSGGSEETVAAIPIDAEFALNRRTPSGYEFEVTSRETEPGLGSSVLKGFWSPGRVLLTGGIRSKAAPSQEKSFGVEGMTVELDYDPNEDYRLQVRILDLFSARSPQEDVFGLIQPLFFGGSNPVVRAQKFFSRFGPTGKADVHLQARGNLRQILHSRFQGTIDCKDVAVRDRRFVYPLDHVAGKIEFTEDSFRTERLVGQHGDVSVLIDFWTKGIGSDWQYEVHVASTRMHLDQDLYAALGLGQKRWWSALDPKGSIAVQYEATGRSPRNERESLLVKPLGTTAAYEKFPYPLRNVTGELLFADNRVILSNLVSEANDASRILLDGTVSELDSNSPQVDLAIQAQNVPLDETLARSLGPSRRALYDPLAMTGHVDAAIKVFTDPNGSPQEGVSFRADVTLKETSMRVCSGSVRLDRGNGHAVLSPTSLILKDLACQYGQAPVQLSGAVFTPTPSACGYRWSVQAQQLPLEDLQAALPLSAQEAVDHVHPTGLVDVTAELDKSDPNNELKYHVQVKCLGDRALARAFPYPLRDLTGQVTVTNDQVVLDAVTARPDVPDAAAPQGLVRASGQITVASEGIKAGRLSLTAENIGLDETLGRALPQELATRFTALAPSGRFTLDPSDIRITTTDEGSREIAFEGRIRMEDWGLHLMGTQATGLATLEVSGVHGIGRGLSEGTIRAGIDRITLKGKSATDLHAVLRYDPTAHSWRTQDGITGRFYGGDLMGRIEVSQAPSEDVRCQMELAVTDANLGAFLEDRLTSQSEPHSTGVLAGRLSLVTSMGGSSSQIGECRFKVTDMQAGRASPLSKALAVLRLSEPSDYIFESLQVDSFIRGDKLLIGQFDVSGASTAFQGTGVLDLTKDDLNLTLVARSRRRLANAEPTALQSLTEGLGGAVVRMQISGPPSDPNITTRTLPVLEESLKLLGTSPQ